MDNLKNIIQQLEFAIATIREDGAPESAIKTSVELLARYKKELKNAQHTERYANDPEYHDKKAKWNRDGIRRFRWRLYCREDIANVENYAQALAEGFDDWDVHHRLQTHFADGTRRTVDISKKELKAMRLYEHRPASELIFLRKSEHRKLHAENKKKGGAR